MFKITALGAAALAACALSVPAAAAPADDDQQSVVVHFGDLNLASPAGTARLNQRLRFAAAKVCGQAGSTDLRMTQHVAGCRAEALNRAKASVELAMQSGGSRVALGTN